MQRLIEIQFKQFNKKLLLPKWRRFLSAPLKYIRGKGIEFLASNNLVSAKEVGTQLFTGQSFSVNLPSGLDLYLVGGKSHDSEIRLAHYLITTLSSKDYFLDIGAH